ncbi:MAG: polymer-forming cytoskeletal protein [bacterium]|nr:polymer-forming cytoskeletal protein [bacterium]
MENTQEFDTMVGEDVELAGSIKNSGSILINGTVKGDVISDESVVVGVNAKVVGPIKAQNVQVAGAVEGSIEASDTLEMLPESRVDGDVKVKTLHVQPGAIFNGSSAMVDIKPPIIAEDRLSSLKSSIGSTDEDEGETEVEGEDEDEPEAEDEPKVKDDTEDDTEDETEPEEPIKKPKPKLELEE